MTSPDLDPYVRAWEAARAEGQTLTPDELAPGDPDLASRIGARLAILQGDADHPTINPARVGYDPSMPYPPQVGDYILKTLLGQGGMGAVFRAEDVRLGRQVAIKLILPAYAAQEKSKARFLREARSQANVTHDYITPIYQVGEQDGMLFIAMPLLVGESLRSRLNRGSPLPLEMALRIGAELAEGLAAAHGKGVIHRDMKPGNVWLEGDLDSPDPGERFRRCKILDFGLSRVGDEVGQHMTNPGEVLGTPAYMAPEQADGSKVDDRTDLFSLGVMLYELTTGKQPFEALTAIGAMINVTTLTPPAANIVNPELPRPVSELIERLMSKKREDRPGPARAVAATLRQFIDKHTTGPWKPTTPGTVPSIDAEFMERRTPMTTPDTKEHPTNWLPEQPMIAVHAPAGRKPAVAIGCVVAVGCLLTAVGLGGGLLLLGPGGKPVEVASRNEDVPRATAATAVPPPPATAKVTAVPMTVPKSETRLRVAFRNFPSDAKVTFNEDPTANAVGAGEYDAAKRSHEVTVERPGYKPTRLTIRVEDADAEGRIRLDFPTLAAIEPDTEITDSLGQKYQLIRASPGIAKPYYMARTEVTRGQFRRFAEAAQYETNAERAGTGVGYDPTTAKVFLTAARFHWREVGFPQTDDHPVLNVTWEDAAKFCAWLSAKEGRIYRLPTEDEWGFAARGGEKQSLPFSLAAIDVVLYANVCDDSLRDQWLADNAKLKPTRFAARDGYAFTAPVGKLRPNRFGLFDCYGNAQEWTAGTLADDANKRIVLGGSYLSSNVGLLAERSAHTATNPSVLIGFRVCAELKLVK